MEKLPQLSQEILDKVFLSYDIRGTVPDQLTTDFYYQLGKAFPTFLNAKKICLGYDFRPDSKDFHKAMVEGATSVGCDVVDLGEISTEMLYFAAGSDVSLGGGITVTASHNPAGWNGCKLVRELAGAISKETGLLDIKRIISEQSFRQSNYVGKVEQRDISADYKAKVLSFLGGTTIKPMRVIVDAGNGIGGKVFNLVFGDSAMQIERMYFEPDGTFPNHEANPLKEENVAEIKKRVVEEGFDMGVALDGDADRCVLIDRRGRNIPGVFMIPILAKHLLKNSTKRGEKIIHELRVTRPITNEVPQMGGVLVPSLTGHTYFKQSMRDAKALFGGESSSHFYYRDFYYADSALITVAILLDIISEGDDLADIVDYYFDKYPMSGEVNYEVSDIPGILRKVEETFSDGKIDKMDGISVDYPDWRLNLRASNTQPLIRLNVEGATKELIIEKFKILECLINGKRENVAMLAELN